MKEEKIYLVSADIADRAQCKDSSYRTKDGRYIISEKALRDFRFRMTAEEYVNGLDAEIITKEEAMRLTAENNYLTGTLGLEVASPAGESAGQGSEQAQDPAPEQEPGQEEGSEETENQETTEEEE